LGKEDTAKQKKRIPKVSKSQRNIVDKDAEKSKYIRLGIWAVFLIVVSGVAAFFLPEHSVASFFDLLKTIITSLIL
jgi:hypothetical protein